MEPMTDNELKSIINDERKCGRFGIVRLVL